MKCLRACEARLQRNAFSMVTGAAMTATSIRLHQDECAKTAMSLIVTHNIQQAGRAAEETGFFGDVRRVEFNSTYRSFTSPSDKRSEDY
jgi:ABC-type phosphate transport system ATPase subunit